MTRSILKASLLGFTLALLAGAACDGGVVGPPDACGGCGEGRICEGSTCVCAPPALPCSPACAADDATCERGTYDEAACRCQPLSPTTILESIALTPSPIVLEVGQSVALTATGHFSSGEDLVISTSVDWAVQPGEIGGITSSGSLTAARAGAATVTATVGTVVGSAPLTVTAGLPKELRGLWVTRWNYGSAADVERIMGEAKDAGFNTIFFQVRGRADAYYHSNVEPWASELSGTLGQDPGWDPLATALAAARTHGLELHAWINTVPVWTGATAPPESTPRHVLLDHPDWLMVDEGGRAQTLGDTGYLCLSPGIPAARAHLLAVMEDLLSSYDVDGLHLDYIRYYGRTFSHDAASEQAFATAQAADASLTWEDWQRDQVAEIVRGAWAITRGHPGVKLTAAVWHNNDLAVTGSRGRRDYYQDSHAWLAEGIVDAIVPMNYMRIDSDPSFATLADDHLAHVGSRHVYMGVHVLGRSSEADPTGAEMIRNIEYARSVGSQGVVLFAYPYLADNALWDELSTGPFAEAAEPPPITW
ncbi:MAG: family 10 glycosylhydrolase [Deltaproteobacteria bacterium]|nr:family 10 glycosylhydrolase [Deltaproteobacteria bacterium]